MLSNQLRASGFKGSILHIFLYLEESGGRKSHSVHAPFFPGQQRALQLHEKQTLSAPSVALPALLTKRLVNPRPAEPYCSPNLIPLKTYSHSLRINSTHNRVNEASVKENCVAHSTADCLRSHQSSHTSYIPRRVENVFGKKLWKSH